MCPISIFFISSFATQHRNTNVDTVKWINRLAPGRPDLIFTTAMTTPKYFYITKKKKANESAWDDNIGNNNQQNFMMQR